MVYMTPFQSKFVLKQSKTDGQHSPSIMTPHFLCNYMQKKTPFKVNCPETKQNRKTIFPMTLNTIDDTSFPTHSDTHFLSKNVENLTPFQIKLSRNKEKQTDNIQMTLYFFQLNCPETK